MGKTRFTFCKNSPKKDHYANHSLSINMKQWHFKNLQQHNSSVQQSHNQVEKIINVKL